MANPRRRRSSRQLEDLPGLFDEIDSKFKVPDPRLAILEQHRKHQISTHGLSPDIDTTLLRSRRKMQFISFGSGSSGNCSYLGIADEGGIIIDAGVDATQVINELKRNAIPLDSIAGILLTHDHSDHVRFAYPLLRKLPKPLLYCTPRTLNGMLQRSTVSKRIKDYHKAIFHEFGFEAGPFMAVPFEVSHDGSDNVGFCITADGNNFVVATDMGIINERADFYIRKANYLMIESNYDAAMLAAGKYPEHLKARIRGDQGHLNNTVTAAYLAQVWQPHLTDVFLCHLSADNNRPEIALRVSQEALESRGLKVGSGDGSIASQRSDIRLSALPRFESSPLYIFRL